MRQTQFEATTKLVHYDKFAFSFSVVSSVVLAVHEMFPVLCTTLSRFSSLQAIKWEFFSCWHCFASTLWLILLQAFIAYKTSVSSFVGTRKKVAIVFFLFCASRLCWCHRYRATKTEIRLWLYERKTLGHVFISFSLLTLDQIVHKLFSRDRINRITASECRKNAHSDSWNMKQDKCQAKRMRK